MATVRKSWTTGERPFPQLLAAAVLLAHGYSMWAIGATYWADSIDYVGFAGFIAAGVPERFYAGDRFFLMQHQMPGVPLLWALISQLEERLIWYALAVVQHGWAAAALITFALALRPFLAPWTILVGALSTSLHPFFSAFHNGVMTESIMSSCALFAGAQFVNCYANRSVSVMRASLTVTSVVTGSMFRSYFLLFGVLLCLGLLLFCRDPKSRIRATLCVGLIGLSIFAFPIYRYGVIDRFFLPNLDFIEPTMKSLALPGLTARAELALRGLPELSSVVSIEKLRERPIAYGESIELSKRMLSAGQTEQEVRTKLRSVAGEMMTDRFLHNLRFTGSAIGLLVVPFAGDPNGPGQLYMKVADLQQHQQYYYRWFASTQQADYLATFEAFSRSYAQDPDPYLAPSIDRYVAALTPHIARSPLWARDPLRLAAVPPDLFVAAWLLFLFAMAARAPGIALLFLLPVTTVFIACLAVPIGSIRYAHPLIPFYLFGASFTFGWAAEFVSSVIRRRVHTTAPAATS